MIKLGDYYAVYLTIPLKVKVYYTYNMPEPRNVTFDCMLVRNDGYAYSVEKTVSLAGSGSNSIDFDFLFRKPWDVWNEWLTMENAENMFPVLYEIRVRAFSPGYGEYDRLEGNYTVIGTPITISNVNAYLVFDPSQTYPNVIINVGFLPTIIKRYTSPDHSYPRISIVCRLYEHGTPYYYAAGETTIDGNDMVSGQSYLRTIYLTLSKHGTFDLKIEIYLVDGSTSGEYGAHLKLLKERLIENFLTV